MSHIGRQEAHLKRRQQSHCSAVQSLSAAKAHHYTALCNAADGLQKHNKVCEQKVDSQTTYYTHSCCCQLCAIHSCLVLTTTKDIQEVVEVFRDLLDVIGSSQDKSELQSYLATAAKGAVWLKAGLLPWLRAHPTCTYYNKTLPWPCQGWQWHHSLLAVSNSSQCKTRALNLCGCSR